MIYLSPASNWVLIVSPPTREAATVNEFDEALQRRDEFERQAKQAKHVQQHNRWVDIIHEVCAAILKGGNTDSITGIYMDGKRRAAWMLYQNWDGNYWVYLLPDGRLVGVVPGPGDTRHVKYHFTLRHIQGNEIDGGIGNPSEVCDGAVSTAASLGIHNAAWTRDLSRNWNANH